MEGVFCEPDPSGSVRGQVGETSGKVDGGVCMSGPVAVYQLRVLVRPAASSAAKGFRVSIGFWPKGSMSAASGTGDAALEYNTVVASN